MLDTETSTLHGLSICSDLPSIVLCFRTPSQPPVSSFAGLLVFSSQHLHLGDVSFHHGIQTMQLLGDL